MTLKCILAGTRTINEYRLILEAIEESGWSKDITEIVSGASEEDILLFNKSKRVGNVDILGAFWAYKNKKILRLYPANWKKYGRKAGPLRNQLMANYADALILIWNGESRGSANMLSHAKAYGLKIYQKIVSENIDNDK